VGFFIVNGGIAGQDRNDGKKSELCPHFW